MKTTIKTIAAAALSFIAAAPSVQAQSTDDRFPKLLARSTPVPAPRPARPLPKPKFLVTVGDVEIPGFTEVTGMDLTTEVIDYREGNTENKLTRQPGLTKYAPVVMKRGLDHRLDISDWARTRPDLDDFRRTVIIRVSGPVRETGPTFKLSECWPSKYTPMEVHPDGLRESITIVCDDVQRTR